MITHNDPTRLILLSILIATSILFLASLFIPSAPRLADIHIQASSAFHPRPPKWLIATMTPVQAIQRRHIIRQTWQRLYPSPNKQWETRFVVSNAGPLWQPLLEAENATYGDIIQLKHLKEDSRTANTIKSVEFLKYVVRDEGDRWLFVSKIDDDSFLDAVRFWKGYLKPLIQAAEDPGAESSAMTETQHLSDNETAKSPIPSTNNTMIGRTLHHGSFTYPGGQFYTLSADLVRALADLHTANPIADEDEDVLVGRLLSEAGRTWAHVDLPNPVAFDFAEVELEEAGKAFAANGADLTQWSHAVGPGAINPHKLRDAEMYLRVAACFDVDGVKVGQ